MMTNPRRWMALTAPCVFGLLLASAGLAAPALRAGIDDGFNGSTIDANRWTSQISDPANITFSEGAGVLSMHIDGSAADNSTGQLLTRCKAHGDFDARVTYSLPLWPFGDAAHVSLDAHDLGPYGVGRFSDPAYDQYFSYLPPVVSTLLTNDLQGQLRLTRHGSRLTAYIRQGQQWRQVDAQRDAPTIDTRIKLLVIAGAAPGTPFGHQSFRVDYDSFSLRAQRISC